MLVGVITNDLNKAALGEKDLYIRAAEGGGTITGEHGIGRKRKKYLSMFMTADEINTMKKIKKPWTPIIL